MKKCIYIFAFALVITVLAQTEVVLIASQPFNTYLPSGWSQNPPFSSNSDWHQGTFPGTGSNCAMVRYETNNDDSLFTPNFDASAGFDSVVVQVLEDYELFGGGGSGSAYILVSSNGGTSWSKGWTYGRTGIDAAVNRYRIEFWAGSSANAKVCFWYDNNYDVWWALDNVAIFGYLPQPEPAPPCISHLGPKVLYPYGTTSVPVLAYVNDFSGVNPNSVEICYRVNGEPYECHRMTYETGLPNGCGNYTYVIPDLVGWDELDYYMQARDLHAPPNTATSPVYSTIVEGPYYIYQNNSGLPMSPDTHWVTGFTHDLDALEADDARLLKTGLPFPVVFFGREFDSIWVCSNGWMKFGSDPGGDWFWTEFIPTINGLMNNFLAWAWDDLIGSPEGSYTPRATYYEHPAGDYIIFSFESWHQLGIYDTAFNVQVQIWNPVVIHQPGGNSAIDVRFNKLPRNINNLEMGVENLTGEIGKAFHHTGGIFGDPSYSFHRQRTIRYSTQPPPSGLVYGNVNLEGSSDNSGAEIGCVGLPYSTLSSHTGNYRLETIPLGTYDIYCYHPSYFPDTIFGVVVSVGDSVELNFSLEPRTVGFIEGLADLTDTGPVGDPGIQIVELRTGLTAVTNASGYFFIDGVRIGDVQVIASRPGYVPDYTPVIALADGETLDTESEYRILALEPITPVWSEGFEATGGGAVSSGLWEWGAPIVVGPPSAHGGVRCWATRLNDYYTIGYGTPPAGIYTLNIPVPSINGTELSFWQWIETEEFGGEMEDGGNFWISSDGGAGWTPIADPQPAYNGIIDDAWGNPMGGESAWGRGPSGWQQVKIDITDFGPVTNILMRFGIDDYASYDAGWYLDDFAISRVGPFKGAVEGYVYDCRTYGVLANARVTVAGRETMTNSAGYFFIDNVPYGNQELIAIKYGYFANNTNISVFIDDTVMVSLPICPIMTTEISGHLAYGEDDTVYFEICNTSDDTVWFSFPPLPMDLSGDARSSGIVLDVGPNPSDPLAYDRSSGSSSDLSRPRSPGETWQIYPATECAVAWGVSVLANKFWVGDAVAPLRDYIYHRPTGYFTGTSFNVSGIGGASWMADMCWDPIRGVVWQLAVGGSGNLYAINPTTGAVVDSIYDPAGFWNSFSHRGVGFDPDNDIFYIGGWNSNSIYKIYGPSWPMRGRHITGYSAPGCAGIAYHPLRRTIWFAVNGPVNTLAEIDPNSNTIINTMTVPASAEYALAGLELDERGRFWVVDQAANEVLVIDGPVAGMFVEPNTGYLAPGDCHTFGLVNNAWMTPVGDYCFDIDFFYGDLSVPYSIPTCVQVQPRANKGWELITVPLNAVPNNPYIQLVDDITPFSVDPTSSNIYGYNQDAGTLELPTGFIRGKGYFLLSWLDNTYWDVYGSPFAEGNFTHSVYFPESSPNWGWWLLGNPFNRRLDWDAVYAYNDFTYLDAEYFSWSRKNGWTWYSPIVGGGGEDNLIDAWRGFFIYTRRGNPAVYTNITYPAVGTMPTFLSKIKTPAKGTAVVTEAPEPFALRVSVKGVSGSDIRYDNYNYFSVHDLALDDFDDYDVREPAVTPPAGAIDAHFRLEALNLSRDTRQNFSESSKSWTFRVRNIPSGMAVTLAWPRNRVPTGDDASCGVENLDPRWSVTLRDNVAGITVNMRADTSYSFVYASAPREFIITLNDIWLDVTETPKPDRFAVGPNMPNPFNASTEFLLELPEGGDVRVEVFDLLGKRVTTLIDGQMDAGWHRVVWKGRDDAGRELPSGVYLYRVIAGDFCETRKMTLIK